ncbi:response regulator [Magnetococcales bacterium HHB-1]
MTDSLQRILYAEDEPDIQEVAVLALEAVGGFSLKVCSTGKEAVEAIDDYNPDLILLDVMMPEMDGPTALLEIRKIPSFQATPAIFMTAKVQPQEIESYRVMGRVEVISKPFDPMTLADTIRDLWQKIQK